MKRDKIFLICIILCFLPFMLTAQPERENNPSAKGGVETPGTAPHDDMMGNAGDASYAGTWECIIDEERTVILILKENGGAVAGLYAPPEDKGAAIMKGEIRGRAFMNMGKKLLDGVWSNEAGESGWLRFDITDDGGEFYGSWGYGEERVQGHSWNGKKAKD